VDSRGHFPAGELPFDGLPILQRPKQLSSQEDREGRESGGRR